MEDLNADAPEYIHFVSTKREAKKIVDHLLCLERPLCLPVVFKRAGVMDSKVSLLGISMNSDYFIFDLRDASSIFVQSGLFRLFATAEIIKVTHDGLTDLLYMSRHQRVAVNAIFDTHKAFDRVAAWNGMPTRKISISDLHEKLNAITWELNIEEAELDAVLRDPIFVDRTGMDWGQRPVTAAMMTQLSAELAALRQCYYGLRSIGKCFDNLQALSATESPEKSVIAVGSSSIEERDKALCSGIKKHLLSMGQSVLDRTLPMAEFRLIPYCYQNN